MELVKLQCPYCGANIDVDKNREFGFCSYCGGKIFIASKNDATGQIINRNPEIENLLFRANEFLESNQIDLAETYFNKVLDIDAKNADARKGMLEIDRHILEDNVFISRGNSGTSVACKAHLYANEKEVAKVSLSENTSIKLSCGKYKMYYILGGMKSNVVEFEISSRRQKVNVFIEPKIIKYVLNVDVEGSNSPYANYVSESNNSTTDNIAQESKVEVSEQSSGEIKNAMYEKGNNKKTIKDIIFIILEVFAYMLCIEMIILGIYEKRYFLMFTGLVLLPIVYKSIKKICENNIKLNKHWKKFYIAIVAVLLFCWSFDFEKGNNNLPEEGISIEALNYEEGSEIVKASTSENNYFTQDFVAFIKSTGIDYNKMKKFEKYAPWNNGDIYQFWYNSERYYMYVSDTYNGFRIKSVEKSLSHKDTVYENNFIIEDDDKDTIVLRYNELGEYGKEDIFSGDTYIRHYIPAGTYEIKTLIRNSQMFIEKRKKYKNSDGYDDSEVVSNIKLVNVGDVERLTIKSDECIQLIMGTCVSIKKVN